MATESKDNGNRNDMVCTKGNEIINIGCGQSGVYMLNEYYSTIMNEHKINKQGIFTGSWNQKNDKYLMQNHRTYFNEDKENKFIPRAIFMDCDETPIDKLRESYLGSILPETHFYSSGFTDCWNIWPRGHYTDGPEIIDEAVNIIRRECERCDMLQGFQIFHSMVGGFGGGFGSLLLLKLRDNYPDRAAFSYSLCPSTSKKKENFPQHHHVLAIYNSIFTMHHLIENTDLCYVLDNGKLLNIAQNQCKLEYPTYDDINWILSQVMSGTTSTMRFIAEPTVNTTMNAHGTCFVAFPRMHFLTLSHTPFWGKTDYEFNDNVDGIIGDLMTNDVSGVELKDDKILNVALVYRGNEENAIAKMDEYIMNVQGNDKEYNFAKWIPDINVQSAFVYDGDNHCYDKCAGVIGTAIIHTTAVRNVFQRIKERFDKMFERKGFVYLYKNEGMDEFEFQEAQSNVRDLITEYQDRNDTVVDEKTDTDEDED